VKLHLQGMKLSLCGTLKIKGFCPVPEVPVLRHSHFDPVDVGVGVGHKVPGNRKRGQERT
jgi:hypothetical protein